MPVYLIYKRICVYFCINLLENDDVILYRFRKYSFYLYFENIQKIILSILIDKRCKKILIVGSVIAYFKTIQHSKSVYMQNLITQFNAEQAKINENNT